MTYENPIASRYLDLPAVAGRFFDNKPIQVPIIKAFYNENSASCAKTFFALSMTFLRGQTTHMPDGKLKVNNKDIINWQTGLKDIKDALHEGKVVGVRFKILGDHYFTMWSIGGNLEIAHGWQDQFFFETYEHTERDRGLALLETLVQPAESALDGDGADERKRILMETFWNFFGEAIPAAKRPAFEDMPMWKTSPESLSSLFNFQEIHTGFPSTTFPHIANACFKSVQRNSDVCKNVLQRGEEPEE